MTQLPLEVYARAAALCEWNLRGRVRNVSVAANWLGEGDAFWYERQLAAGSEVVCVDPERAKIEVVAERPHVDAVPPGVLRSPDGSWHLEARAGDLFLAPAGSLEFRALTTDGEPDFGYGLAPGSSTVAVSNRRAGVQVAPVAVWSADSTRILTHRLDQRQVPELHLLEAAPSGRFRPVLHTYRMPFVGDPLASAELLVIDVPSGRISRVEGDPLLVEFLSPLELGWGWWGADGDNVWFLREARGATRLTLCAADAATGAVRELIVESSESYVEPYPLLPWPSAVRAVRGETQIVWPSERDGWRHLYLFDAASGALIRQLTAGDWLVRDVLHADREWVWFTGLGREPGLDPYFRIVYRVPLDGGEPERVTPEPADHSVAFSPSGRFFIDVASTAATAPVSRLRHANGELVATLETADLSALYATNWRPPERFTVKAADGVTQIHGALFLPSDFDPDRSYPVIDSIYHSPHLIRTQIAFGVDSSLGADEWPGQWSAQALAELGFAVITVDGRGSPLRRRAFREASTGRLQEYALDDHIAAMRTLASERPWMDLDRVGIAGHSGGAAAAVRAVIEHPDVFKAAAAGSGDHDLRRYLAYWGEKYQGLGPDFDYGPASNIEQAHRLERPLLLLHGELDDNVHPSNTLALVDALVRADRDFEFVIIPGANHACDTHPYYVRRVWDFFVRELLGRKPPSAARPSR
jgi:dipeptidyl-peptidase-4